MHQKSFSLRKKDFAKDYQITEMQVTRYILEWYFLHYLPTYYITYTQCTHSWLLQYPLAEIKPCGLGSRIWYVEAFWYKTEFKIIYFVKLCLIVLIVSDCLPWIYFLSTYNKFRVRVNHPIRHNQRTKKWPHFFLRLEADFF